MTLKLKARYRKQFGAELEHAAAMRLTERIGWCRPGGGPASGWDRARPRF
jgi:hypothetical protein